ncbi:hypothetical protein Y032_0034g2888 [Ancylostoma ceylanicum]|uniref:Uncharacterized protein n=1 Tax=Ancylostoma ceylanicum TaxID=53326 RepID=A0A016ULI5_9BILA|nr:hypothetical protein Y032_0034g2888 [Ancylostoma ceylanicum]
MVNPVYIHKFYRLFLPKPSLVGSYNNYKEKQAIKLNENAALIRDQLLSLPRRLTQCQWSRCCDKIIVETNRLYISQALTLSIKHLRVAANQGPGGRVHRYLWRILPTICFTNHATRQAPKMRYRQLFYSRHVLTCFQLSIALNSHYLT